MQLPSDLNFVSFLQYSPRGQSQVSRQSQVVMLAVKDDKAFASGERAIEYAARRVREELAKNAALQTCFGTNTWLVPVPRSAPLVQGGLWPTRRMCDALQKEGIAGGVLPAISRVSAVRKSATAGPGQRPTPEVHYNSLAVAANVNLHVASLTIVDDIVTRGATFIACYARLREVYPQIPIQCFGLIRTMSGVEVDSILQPVAGIITLRGTHLHREP